MTNMFKKTLIAAAVAGISTSAMAADVINFEGVDGDDNVIPFVYSAQGVARAADDEIGTDNALIAVELNATYADGDTITIDFSGADVDVAASSPELEAQLIADDTTITGANVGFLSASDNSLTFRIVDSTGLDDTAKLVLTGVVLDGTTFTGPVSVSYSAETSSGLAIDNTGRTSAEVLDVEDQFEVAVNESFDGVIDVADERKTFETATNTDTDDALTIDLTDNAGELEVTPVEIVHTIYGNFSELVDDAGDALAAADFVSAAPDGVDGDPDTFAGYEFAEDMQSVSFVQTVNTEVAEQAVVTFDVDGGSGAAAEAISTQSFTADVEFTDGTDPADTFASFDAVDVGGWTLNGAEAYVPYMPYGANISQVLYITNNGSQTGDITVDIRDEAGELTSNVSVGQAAPGTTKITGAVLQAVEDATGKTLGSLNATGSEKVSLNIVVNAPTDEVEVYSAYNVGGSDRGLVINSSNKNK